MRADSYFKIGTTHQINQDYAINRMSALFKSSVFIGDGCSGSKDSDIGARILVKTADSVVHQNWWLDPKVLARRILADARLAANAIKVHIDALYSTLFMLYESEGKLVVCGFGDGVIAARTKEGELEIIEINYSNAPYYLNYESNIECKEGFIKEFGGVKTITTNGKKEESQVVLEEVDFTLRTFDKEKYELVAVMSDGASQFVKPIDSKTSKTAESISTKEIVETFLDFKPTKEPNYNGEFVKRRANAIFRNNPEWQNLDDFSIGVIAHD